MSTDVRPDLVRAFEDAIAYQAGRLDESFDAEWADRVVDALRYLVIHPDSGCPVEIVDILVGAGGH